MFAHSMQQSTTCPICGVKYRDVQKHMTRSGCGLATSSTFAHHSMLEDVGRPPGAATLPHHLAGSLPEEIRIVAASTAIASKPNNNRRPPRASWKEDNASGNTAEVFDGEISVLSPAPQPWDETDDGFTNPTGGDDEQASTSQHVDDNTLTQEFQVNDSPNLVVRTTTAESPLPKPTPRPLETRGEAIVLSTWERAMVGLYRVCDSVGAPLGLGDKVVDWLKMEMRRGFNPRNPAITRRTALMRRLHKAGNVPAPEAIPVTLESGHKVTVYRFPFLPTLQRHLMSDAFGRLDNLQLYDTSRPWCQRPPVNEGRSELHSGRWFQQTYDAMNAASGLSSSFMLHPLLLYIDKTGTTMNQTCSLEPLMATSTLLRSAVREKAEYWFPIGMMPNTGGPSSAQHRLVGSRQASRSLSIRDYHQCLRILLNPLHDIQQQKPQVEFRRGAEVAEYRILCPVAGVIGDNLACDLLCGRVQDYGPSCPRISRRCMTPSCEADATQPSCQHIHLGSLRRLSMGALGCTHGLVDETDGIQGVDANNQHIPAIPLSPNLDWWKAMVDSLPTAVEKHRYVTARRRRQTLCDKVLHRVFASHAVDNAFDMIDFGCNTGGIQRATLGDIMHTIEEGIIPRLTDIILGPMSATQLAKVDDVVASLLGNTHRSSERNAYPRVSQTRGFSSMTLLSADEQVGQLFVLAILLQTKQGRHALGPRFAVEFDQDHARPQKRRRDNMPAHAPTAEVAEGCRQKVPSSLDDVRLFLDQTGMSYLLNDIYPTLPQYHQELLVETLQDVIRPAWVREVANVQVPPHRWDYQWDEHWEAPDAIPLVRPTRRRRNPRYRPHPSLARCSIRLGIEGIVYLLETIMTFHSFLKYGLPVQMPFTPTVQEQYEEALATLREVVVAGVAREQGHGWRLQKFHELCHFCEDIVDFGWPDGYSTSTGERGLKVWAKRPAQTAQRHSESVFSSQVSERIQDAALLQQLHEAHDDGDATRGEEDPIPLLRHSYVVRDNHLLRQLPNGKYSNVDIQLPPVVAAWFASHFPAAPVKLHFELKLGPNHSTLVRAHPTYRQGEPWYDFVSLAFDIEGTHGLQHFPARCVCFFTHPTTGEHHVLVQEADYQTAIQARSRSQLLTHWTLGASCVAGVRKATLVEYPVATIGKRIYAIMENQAARHLEIPIRNTYDFLWVGDRRDDWPLNFLVSPTYLPRH